MNIVWSFVKTIFGHEYIWKWFQPLLSSITVQWQGQCVSRVDGRAGHFFFFSRDIRQCLQKSRKERVNISQTCFIWSISDFDIQKNESVFGFMELSQEKPFILISDNVQIAARQQWNGKSPQMKKNVLKVKIKNAGLNYA